jgi:hypothetical protein
MRQEHNDFERRRRVSFRSTAATCCSSFSTHTARDRNVCFGEAVSAKEAGRKKSSRRRGTVMNEGIRPSGRKREKGKRGVGAGFVSSQWFLEQHHEWKGKIPSNVGKKRSTTVSYKHAINKQDLDTLLLHHHVLLPRTYIAELLYYALSVSRKKVNPVVVVLLLPVP